MERIKIELVHPKAMQLLEVLEELELITIIRDATHTSKEERKIEILKHLETIMKEDREVLQRLADYDAGKEPYLPDNSV